MNHRHKLTIANGLLGMVAGLVFVALLTAPSALAAQEPWWHLIIGNSPATIQPGQAKDEVEEVTVSATGGTYMLGILGPPAEGSPIIAAHEFSWNASDSEVQVGLEEVFGSGTVEVLPVQSSQPESHSYRIVFTGTLADTWIETLFGSGAGTLTGGEAQVKVKEITQGRSDGRLILTGVDMSAEGVTGSETPFTMTDKLPPGLTAVGIEGLVEYSDEELPMECSLATLSCKSSGRVAAYEQMQMYIDVNVKPGATAGETDELAASGGNARDARKTRDVAIGDAPVRFGVENYELTPEEADGSIDTQAGSHPFQLTTVLDLNRNYEEPECGGCGDKLKRLVSTPALDKDLNFKLPPGLIGNPTPFPQCTLAAFLNSFALRNACQDSTVVGVVSTNLWLNLFRYFRTMSPLFNLTPSVGEPARFGFYAEGVPVILDTAVRTGGDYGVTVSVKNIPETAQFLGSRVTFWGVPGDPRHDSVRGWSCLQNSVGRVPSPCNASEAHHPPPLLELPTSCTGPMQTSVEADSWKEEGVFSSVESSAALPALDGCNTLPFTPSIVVASDGTAGSAPTGLNVHIDVPQEVSLNPEGLGEADVKNTTVTLPAGVALNPAAADGLQACSEEQVALEVHAQTTCPEASKVATLEVKSPLLPNALTGEAYLAAQTANPFGSLVALYLVAQDPVSGTLIKLAGEVKLDPVTGQLVSTFKNTPQLPFEELKLHFFGGDRAPLATPALCGAYTTVASIEPWSGNSPTPASSTFDIDSGPNGSPCASPLPFNPSLTTGSTNIQAGAFSAFTMTMSREDGQQNLKAVKLHMPSGLLGTLASVKLCGEAQANAGTCGPESQIGETIVSVGLGGDPYSVTGGKVYITEGYGGAPYGLSIVNPAKAGPYNLGTVVVRAKIEVDPITAVLTVTTDPSGPYAIPQILDGIPLEIKHINVTINRPDFTFNPTNCTPTAITGELLSVENVSKALSVPYQVTNCATLAFKPQFKVSTSGKTSRANGASLQVKLTYPKAAWGTQANIKSVKVDLPKQLPSRLTTLQKACPNTVFEANPAACPADSRVGSVTATTPIIPVGLSGPAYFVSYGGAKFPELVIVLSGYGVTVDLHGETFISPAGITSSTFRAIPDVPIGGFELKLPEGRFSALGANKDLCTVKGGLKMPTVFTAQNGLVIKQSTKMSVTGCPKAKAKKAHKGKKK